MTTGGSRSRRSPRPPGRNHRQLAGALAAVLAAVMVAVLWIAPPAEARQGGPSVDVDIEIGYGGTLPSVRRLPARIALTADRSRQVEVSVASDQWSDALRYRTETVAGETVDLDIVLPGYAASVDIVVRDGETVVGRDSQNVLDRSSQVSIAGVAPSLHTGKTTRVDLLGSTATAQLVDVELRDLQRPGFLDGMAQLVLGPSDADALSDDQRRALGHWVVGGNVLSLDMAPADPLPALDLAQADAGPLVGERIAVGAGWVVFTGGAASAGRWGDVLEPPQVDPTLAGQQQGIFGGGFGGPDIAGQLMSLPLVRSSFPSAWLIAAIAFGSIVVLGPVLWLVLRTPRRRTLMWIAAPVGALLVTGAAAVAGGDQLNARATREVTTAELDQWGWRGDVATATVRGTDIAAPAGAAFVSATDGIHAVDDGGDITLSPVRGDEFGVVAVAGVTSDRSLGVDASAELTADGDVAVTIRNGSASRLAQVQAVGFGLTDTIPDVAPQRTATAIVALDRSRAAFGPAVNATCGAPLCGVSPAFSTAATRNSIGVLRVQGMMRTSSTTLGGRENLVAWGINVAVRPRDEPARSRVEALRVDALGPVTTTQIDPTGKVIEGQDDTGATVRIIAPTDRPSQACAAHTAFADLSAWDGTAWVPLPKTGRAFDNARFTAPNEFQRYQFPALRAGVPLYVRAAQLFDMNGAAMAIDCGQDA